MPWNDPTRPPNPTLQTSAPLRDRVQAMLDDKRATLQFLQENGDQYGWSDYMQGNVNCLHQVIADLQALLV